MLFFTINLVTHEIRKYNNRCVRMAHTRSCPQLSVPPPLSPHPPPHPTSTSSGTYHSLFLIFHLHLFLLFNFHLLLQIFLLFLHFLYTSFSTTPSSSTSSRHWRRLVIEFGGTEKISRAKFPNDLF